MLRELLDLIREGRPLTSTECARALDATPMEVDIMLRDLTARGYLRDVDCGEAGACGGCAGCPAARSCTEAGGARPGAVKVWALTEKGRRAASVPREAAAPRAAGEGAGGLPSNRMSGSIVHPVPRH